MPMPTTVYQRKLPLEIKKSNELVRARIDIENNVLVNKLFYLAVRNVSQDCFPEVSVSVKELAVTEQRLDGKQYEAIKEACKVLRKAGVEKIYYDTGSMPDFGFYSIFINVRYEKGIIKVHFVDDMKHHLLELQKKFTSLNYFELMDLPSFYSQRIYEIIKSWEKPEGFVEIGLNDFYEMISFPKEMRTDFSFVRRKALEKSEKDINARTDLKYTWEPIKEGRKVVGLRFIIGERGLITQKKRQNKEAEKKRREDHDEAARRKPHLLAAKKCQLANNIRPGDICKQAKPYTQKCKWCHKGSAVVFYDERLF